MGTRSGLIGVLLLAAICAAAPSTLLTDYRPIVLDPTYEHDRFDAHPDPIE